MKKNIFFFAIAILLIAASCATQQNTVKYTVASKTADCVGVAPQKCLLIKKDGSKEWTFFYGSIEGFNYEEGNEYVLEVKEEALTNVPGDAPSIKYVLVNVVSKTATTSEGLPEMATKIIPAKTDNLQWTGKVLDIQNTDIGTGGAKGKFAATVLQVEVTSSEFANFKTGDIIYCELTASPKVVAQKGHEYVFKAEHLHPAHAKGVYTLNTDVSDLVR